MHLRTLGYLGSFFGGLAFVSVVVYVVRSVWRGIRHLHKLHIVIEGAAQTNVSDRIPSLLERFEDLNVRIDHLSEHLCRQDARLENLEDSLKPNGLNTTRPGDMLARIERQLADVSTRLANAHL